MSIIKLVTWPMSFEILTKQPNFISNANRWMLFARLIVKGNIVRTNVYHKYIKVKASLMDSI